MKHTTAIDTIKIQVNLTSQEEQQELINALQEELRDTQKQIYIKTNKTRINATLIHLEYRLYIKRNLIATLNTGMYPAGSYIKNTRAMVHYVSIKFAGLSSHHIEKDIASKSSLLAVCDYVNSHRYDLNFKELDICLDVECPYECILTKCTRKTARTKYYTAADRQPYSDTTYIEKIPKQNYQKVAKRAYTYDKSKKEGLPYVQSRVEIKLQATFFIGGKIDIKKIQKTLDSYHVVYLTEKSERQSFTSAYEKLTSTNKREIAKLDIEDKRITFDNEVVEDFILELQNIGRL